jgi:hypothetical protein
VGRRALGAQPLTGFAFGWELLVGAVVLILALMLVGIIALTREPYRHRLKVGFFVERDYEEPDQDDGGDS